MFVLFELVTTNCGSWNGKEACRQGIYAIVRKYKKQDALKITGEKEKSYHYDFGDGWGVNVNTSIVNAEQKKAILKRSLGFKGYSWMVDSIAADGYIHVPAKN